MKRCSAPGRGSFIDIGATPPAGVIEWVAWRVPEPVSPSEHTSKYRAALRTAGKRSTARRPGRSVEF